jgi:hypothetical protein
VLGVSCANGVAERMICDVNLDVPWGMAVQ